VNKVIIY